VLIYKYDDIAHNSIVGQMGIMTQKKYIGDFANNKPNGYGTMIYENGTKFVGFHKDGVRAGLGVEVSNVAEPGQARVNKGIFEGK